MLDQVKIYLYHTEANSVILASEPINNTTEGLAIFIPIYTVDSRLSGAYQAAAAEASRIGHPS